MFPDLIMIRISLFSILFISMTKCDEAVTLTRVYISGTSPVERGQTARIYCDYEHKMVSVVSVQWEKYVYDGDKKSLVYSYIYSESDEALGPLRNRAEIHHKYGRFTLLIHGIDLSDEGRYQCTIYLSYSVFSRTEPYALKVSIPAGPPKVEAINFHNQSQTALQCSGNVGRPGGTLRLFLRNEVANNWTELESLEIQRIYANHTVTTYIKSAIPVLRRPTEIRVRCEAKNVGKNERVFATEKLITVPTFSEEQQISESKGNDDESFHIAGITTLLILAIAILCFGIFLVKRYTNLSLTKCIKDKRSQPTT